MRGTVIAYSGVVAGSIGAMATAYTIIGNQTAYREASFTEIILHPTFTFTAGITLGCAVGISLLVWALARRKPNSFGNLKTGETSTVSGFRVGTKTGTGS